MLLLLISGATKNLAAFLESRKFSVGKWLRFLELERLKVKLFFDSPPHYRWLKVVARVIFLIEFGPFLDNIPVSRSVASFLFLDNRLHGQAY